MRLGRDEDEHSSRNKVHLKGKWPEKESHQHTPVTFIFIRLIAK